MKKAVLITGSTKGIGKATAIEALSGGYFVYLNYAHDDKSAASCADELDTLGFRGSYKIIKADVSDMSSVSIMADQIDNEHSLFGLVLNASSNGHVRNTFGKITHDEMQEMFEMNLFAPFFLVQKLEKKICDGGSIVFISSNAGIYPHSTYIPYGLTKNAEIFLARMLVKEMAPRRITVNAVAPAHIVTEMFPGNRTPEHQESIRKKVAAHRFGTPQEVAKAVMAVLTNPYVNGSVLSVDGGYNFS